VEFLALRDGMLQPVRTNGNTLEPYSDPFRKRPDDASHTGVPQRVVTAEHVPGACRCSWAYAGGRLTLKYSNTACPLLADHQAAPRARPARQRVRDYLD